MKYNYYRKCCLVVISLLTFSFNLFSQENNPRQSPGGVEGNNYWFLSSEKESLPTNLINFYPALSVDDKTVIEHINSLEKSNELTAFVIMKPSFLQEKHNLVDINSNNHQLSIQSDRVKSKRELKIKNFNIEKPYFISYIESFDEENINDSTKLNNQTNNHSNKFEGDVAEIIFYPKLLTKLERRKVETYLSLKYGISLTLKSDYINSKNDTIWKYDESKVFLYRVSGIGRDNGGYFNHKQSSNVDDGQFLTIGLGNSLEAKNELNKEFWQDLNYLMWADDSGNLSFHKEENSPEISVFKRTWKTKLIGDGVRCQNYIFSFDSDLIEQQDDVEKNNSQKNEEYNSKNPELKYWLVFTPETSDKLNIYSAEFIQSVVIPDDGERIEFSDVPLKNQTGSFLFTLIKAPALFALIETRNLNCQTDAHIKVIGGVAPYTIEFYSEENQKFSVIGKDENRFDALNLISGNYICKITDSFNQSYEQIIFINSDTQGAFALEDILLKEGESRTLDLNDFQDKAISGVRWFKDELELGQGTRYSIREEGFYTMNYLTENGCPKTTSFLVTKIPSAEWSGIYPNPVKANEPFFVKLTNSASSKVRITITDFSGRIIKSNLLKKGSEVYSDIFFHQGTYLITVESQSEKFHYTLIVK